MQIGVLTDGSNIPPSEMSNIDDFFVHLANNRIVELHSYLDEFKNELREKDAVKLLEKIINLTAANLVNRKTKKGVLIKKIELKGIIEQENMPFFKITDHVLLIMKSLFENKSFSISVNGNIKSI